MKITIEPDLTTSSEYLFAYPFKLFKNQTSPTKFLKIPLQQRDYDWGNETLISKEGNNISGLLEDLDDHLQNGSDKYFAGTVLLENQNADYFKVIDGQQRITTLFLINFVGYLLSRYRLENMPTFPDPFDYAFEFNERFITYLNFEKRAIISDSLNDDPKQLITKPGQGNSNQELLKRIGKSLQSEQDYWSKVTIRLQFEDIDINTIFISTLKSANIAQHKQTLQIIDSKGLYSNGLNYILEYLIENNQQGPVSLDQYLKELIKKIEAYTNVCGVASIISEDADDSFRLFEILNDRGQDLSALDLIKNIILEKCNQNNIQIKNFSDDWKKLKENVKKGPTQGKPDSVFVENIIRSEGSTLRNKEISYLNNKLLHLRNLIFVNENVSEFFTRLYSASQILRELDENKDNSKTSNTSPFNRNQMSCFQYTTFMRMINYNWGPQVILCSNIQYLKSSRYDRDKCLNSGTNPDWKNHSSNSTQIDLNHFTRFLGDITLKLGLVGVVNGLATKDLPSTSQSICKLIIANVQNNPNNFNNSSYLNKLKQDIIALVTQTILSQNNIQLFETRLANFFLANTGQKRNVIKILLYFIYNQGGQIHNISFPELEHLESANPVAGTVPYYSGSDRIDIINRLGNFALIEKYINIKDFANKPLVEKIRLAFNDPQLKTIALFQHPLFRHLDSSQTTNTSYMNEELFLVKRATTTDISQNDSFDMLGVPQPYFFIERSKALALLATKIVCSTDTFLDGKNKY